MILEKESQNSVERLGNYEPDSNFSDPRLMAAYTLNQLDRANYQEQQLQDADGNAQTGYLYVSPAVEPKHLASIQAQVTDRTASTNLLAQVARVLDEPERSSPELIARIVTAARQIDESGEVRPSQSPFLHLAYASFRSAL